MNLYKIRGGTIEDLEAKKYNIGVGISLGNKWFSVENIMGLIRWSLDHTRENVLVHFGDSIHAINLEIKKRTSYEKALEIANKMGDELMDKVKIEVEKTFSSEQINRIRYAKWNDAIDNSYKSKTKYLYNLYESNEDFRNTLHSIAKSAVINGERTYSEEEIHRLGMYIVEELPYQLNKGQVAGIVCEALVYPYDGGIPKLVEEIQNGEKFPEVKENVIDTEPKVFLEVR